MPGKPFFGSGHRFRASRAGPLAASSRVPTRWGSEALEPGKAAPICVIRRGKDSVRPGNPRPTEHVPEANVRRLEGGGRPADSAESPGFGPAQRRSHSPPPAPPRPPPAGPTPTAPLPGRTASASHPRDPAPSHPSSGTNVRGLRGRPDLSRSGSSQR